MTLTLSEVAINLSAIVHDAFSPLAKATWKAERNDRFSPKLGWSRRTLRTGDVAAFLPVQVACDERQLRVDCGGRGEAG